MPHNILPLMAVNVYLLLVADGLEPKMVQPAYGQYVARWSGESWV